MIDDDQTMSVWDHKRFWIPSGLDIMVHLSLYISMISG